MPASLAIEQSTGSDSQLSTVGDFVALLKPRVMLLVVFTGWVGVFMASLDLSAPVGIFQQLIAVLCIAFASGAGGAINMWYDRDIDAIMQRTRKRPIPAGRVAPDDALAYGIFLAAMSFMLMGLATNWLAAFMLVFAIFFYVVIYTVWLKRRTPQNIVIGGAAGAMPPMIGWAAITGDVSLLSFALFAIIFLWTPPHFWALALYKNEDYAKAGIPMLPVVSGAKNTKLQIVLYSLLLAGCSFSPVIIGASGWLYTYCVAFLNVVFLHHVVRLCADNGDKWAKKTFYFSIIYLFVLFSVLVLDVFVVR